MIAVGIDASASSTGLAWVDLNGGEFTLLAVQAIRTNLAAHKEMTHRDRLEVLYRGVLAALQDRPGDIVHIEQIRVSAQARGYSTFLVARAHQAALMGADHAGQADIVTSSATVWRSRIRCSARTTAEAKEKVRSYVNTRFRDTFQEWGRSYREPFSGILTYGLAPGESDMSDAVGLAMTALAAEERA